MNMLTGQQAREKIHQARKLLGEIDRSVVTGATPTDLLLIAADGAMCAVYGHDIDDKFSRLYHDAAFAEDKIAGISHGTS